MSEILEFVVQDRIVAAAREMGLPWSVVEGVLAVTVVSAGQAFELGVRTAIDLPLYVPAPVLKAAAS